MAHFELPLACIGLESQIAVPRLMRVGDRDIRVFEGLQEPGQHEDMPGYYREDQLVLPRLAAIVSWQNRNMIRRGNHEIADPFSFSVTNSARWASDELLTANLELTAEMLEIAWLQDQDRFVQSAKSIKLYQTPKTEHANLMIRELAEELILVVNTPKGMYLAKPESQETNPITFSQFKPYGWELFTAEPPKPKHLYMPDKADLSVLGAHFITEDPGFGDFPGGPPFDAVPSPLVSV